MGDPADGPAEQEQGKRRFLGQAEGAFDRDGSEVDIGLAAAVRLDRRREPLGGGQRLRAGQGVAP